jgi:hypothetical protein
VSDASANPHRTDDLDDIPTREAKLLRLVERVKHPESALLEGHRQRRRNKGQAHWILAAGRLVIAYEYPDGENLLVARIVTVWRRR